MAGRPGRVRAVLASALTEVRIDPPVRDYLCRLMMLEDLPRPFSTVFGPLNRFLTTGFLPPPFREHMQLPWTESDQRYFGFFMQMIGSVNRLLPPPVSRFPFNACLQDLRVRIMWNSRCSAVTLYGAAGEPAGFTEVATREVRRVSPSGSPCPR